MLNIIQQRNLFLSLEKLEEIKKEIDKTISTIKNINTQEIKSTIDISDGEEWKYICTLFYLNLNYLCTYIFGT